MTEKEIDKFLKENEWIVNTICKQFMNNAKYRNVVYDDLKQNILYFMLRGIKTFRSGKRKLSSHLYQWAQAGAYDYVYKNRTIRIPNGVINDVKNGVLDGSVLPMIVKIDTMTENFDKYTRFDKIMFENFNASASAEVVCNEHFYEELSEHMQHVLENSNLSDIEKFVIYHRFGFGDNEEKTQKEIAKMTVNVFGKEYSTMGICKIEKRAFEKIKKCKFLKG